MMRLYALMVIVICWLSASSLNVVHAAEPSISDIQTRSVEQTLLTYPEWFLVHSPAEYAVFTEHNPPHAFPFIGHIKQLWTSYFLVTKEQIHSNYPGNPGYHVMIMVIASSTTIEYGLRWVYENIIGRVSWALSSKKVTAEDAYAAQVAHQYVTFIREQPWYLFDFTHKLKTLWLDTPWLGKNMLRKWERRYALTTEYLIKAVYAKMIGFATSQAYDPALMTTQVIVIACPPNLPQGVKQLKAIDHQHTMLELPRYYKFKTAATQLALQGARFMNIAGNEQNILVTILHTKALPNMPADSRILFQHPILTAPGLNRYAVLVPIKDLSELLLIANQQQIQVEHIYDF